jgi:ubiquinone/menaquinone biosynthesis C-methylase UbiE/GNAT superfamily N-acetyltransferase
MRTDLAEAFYNASGVTARNDPDNPASRFAVDRLSKPLARVLRPGMRALDLGCGAGRFTFAMEALGAVCTGIDCADVPLRHARQLAKRRDDRCVFCCGDVISLPFATQAFDLVLLADSIVEFSPEEIAAVSAEVCRGLRPNGLFCLSFMSDNAVPQRRSSFYTVPEQGAFEYHSYPWTATRTRETVGQSLDFAWAEELEENRHWMVFRKGPQSLQIRRMQEDDPPAMATAFADMNKPQTQYERYWRENLDGKRVTLVGLLDGKIVGYTNVIWESGYEAFRKQGIPEINDMNTVTGLRKNGIGTRMIEAAEEVVLRAGKRVIGIGVGVTPDYAIAQSLYPKLGYVSDGTGIHPDRWGGCMYSTKELNGEPEENGRRT